MKHQPCPNCPSSDAYWVYEDGHGYCFSCHTPTAANRSIKDLHKKLDIKLPTDLTTVIDTSGFTLSLRSDALRWLSKYEILDSEIKQNHIMWDTNTESLVFPVYHKDNLVVTNSRYFGKLKDYPKYITKGVKTRYYKRFNNVESSTLVLVEDFLSAIKCGRFWHSIPMFGTTMPTARLVELCKNYSTINVWLDPDKKTEALNLSNLINQFGAASIPIWTKNDPKSELNEQLPSNPQIPS